MSELTHQELKTQLERSHEKHELAVEIAEDNETPPAGALASRKRRVGVFTLILGNRSEAIEWFTESAEWYCERWEQLRGEVNEPQMAMWALFTSILAKDTGLTMQIAKDVITEGIEHQDPEYYVHLDNCLANLVVENDEAAGETAEKLVELCPEVPKEVGSYPGLGMACRAIIDEDVADLDVALEDVLDHHNKLEEQRAEGLDHIVVCIPATVLLLIARDRGLPIEETEALQSEHVPVVLFE